MMPYCRMETGRMEELLDERLEVQTTWLRVILDDHSRLIIFAAYYTNGDTAAFLDCLKQAVLRRGLPLKLSTDQGNPIVNHHARMDEDGTRHPRPSGSLSAVCLGPSLALG